MKISGFQPYSQMYAPHLQGEKIAASQGSRPSAAVSGVQQDRVTLSEQGQALQRQSAASEPLLSSLDDFMDGAGRDGVITGDEIRAYAQKYSKETDRIFRETLDSLGITDRSNISVDTDHGGNIRVRSDLSEVDNQRLEKALNEHPEFQQTFVRAANGNMMAQIADSWDGYETAYQQDPRAAVARYAELGKGSYYFEFSRGASGFQYLKSFG